MSPNNVRLQAPADSPKSKSTKMKGYEFIAPIKGAKPGDEFSSTLIKGSSLTGDEIYDGDRVICRLNFHTSELTPGRLILVDTPEGLQVRHIYFMPGNKVRLLASNESYPPLVFNDDQIRVKGIWVRTDRRS